MSGFKEMDATVLKEIGTLREFLSGVMRDGKVDVTFTKVNGEKREMVCTLSEKYIPQSDNPKPTKQKKHNEEVMVVWSVKDNGWRSFRLESVNHIRFSIVDGD